MCPVCVGVHVVKCDHWHMRGIDSYTLTINVRAFQIYATHYFEHTHSPQTRGLLRIHVVCRWGYGGSASYAPFVALVHSHHRTTAPSLNSSPVSARVAD